MFDLVTTEKAINFTRLSVALSCCWPLPASATRSRTLRFKIIRSVAFLNAFLLLPPLLYALCVNQPDTAEFSNAASLAFGVLQTLSLSSLCFGRYTRLQQLVEEMKSCCEEAKPHEIRVLQQYVDTYCTFYGTCAIWFYVTAIVMVVGTVFIEQPFPTAAEYPFEVQHEPRRTIIFIHQALVGLQCSAHVCINVFGALLLLFAAARFEILTNELRDASSVDILIRSIKKYYSLKRYAQEVVSVVKFIALITILSCGVALALCGITCMGHQPATVKVQFFCVAGTALLEVFMCAWPADKLAETSENAIRGVYESLWYEEPLQTQKTVLRMLIPQKPVAIKITHIIPVLTLSYYCSYISNVFSLFTALRIVMKDEPES